MSDWKQLKVVGETLDLCYKMWEKGWTPGGGGNVSVLLDETEVASLAYVPGTGRSRDMEQIPNGVRGRYLLVTASGSAFRALKDDPDHLVGVVYVPEEGDYYEIVCGMEGGRPTGELDSHLAAHAVRLAVDPSHRVVMHNHARSILEMTHVLGGDERAFNVALWKMIPEASLFLSDGLGVVDWCIPCTLDMAALTLDKMRSHRIVVWAFHGIFGTGSSLPELFGHLELAELCCQTWLDLRLQPSCLDGIPEEGIRGIWEHFGVTEHADYID